MSNQTLANMLKQDPFETNEEFQVRINKIRVLAGTGQLLKDFYDIDSGNFPIAVVWEPSVERCLREFLPIGTLNVLKPSVPRTYIVALRDQAKSLFEANQQYPVIAAIQYDQEHGTAIVKELLLQISNNEAIKILTFDHNTVVPTVNTIMKRLKPTDKWKQEMDSILFQQSIENPDDFWKLICQRISQQGLFNNENTYLLMHETIAWEVTSSSIKIGVRGHFFLNWFRDNFDNITYAVKKVTGKSYTIELKML